MDLTQLPLRVVPHELWCMVDCLYRHGMMTPSLWRVPSSPAALAAIRECLDTGKTLEGAKWERRGGVRGSVSDVANTLVEWLESLGSPIIDKSFLMGMETVQDLTCSFVDTLLAMVMG